MVGGVEVPDHEAVLGHFFLNRSSLVFSDKRDFVKAVSISELSAKVTPNRGCEES